jgi:hypothetical protein
MKLGVQSVKNIMKGNTKISYQQNLQKTRKITGELRLPSKVYGKRKFLHNIA